MTTVFWLILGIGVAIPGTIVILTNLTLAMIAKDNYSLNLKQVAVVYFITLLAYATIFGVR